MVHLTRIYTRSGDAGQTRLVDNSVAAKTDPRVEAYGTVDELNSLIGVVLAVATTDPDVAACLATIQNELFDVGSDLATPLIVDPPVEPLRIESPSVDRLEKWCDQFGDPLPELRSFVLPGGSVAAAHLHVARTVCRRAERVAWIAAERYGTAPSATGGVNPTVMTYLNRLSDLLFILARHANRQTGDVLWVPGGARPVDS